MARRTFEQAFNLWMTDFTENPEAYEAIEETAIGFLREQLDGREPTYGQEAAAIFREYLKA
jgi:hypothetical protein